MVSGVKTNWLLVPTVTIIVADWAAKHCANTAPTIPAVLIFVLGINVSERVFMELDRTRKMDKELWGLDRK